jgi:hypothetical protein
MKPRSALCRLQLEELEPRAAPGKISIWEIPQLVAVQQQPVVKIPPEAGNQAGEVLPGYAYGHEHAPGWLEHHALGGGGVQPGHDWFTKIEIE